MSDPGPDQGASGSANPTGTRPKLPTSGSAVITVTEDEVKEAESEETLQLQLKEPKKKSKKKDHKKVVWTEDTVDNEHLGKKKSKCCCVYVKPKVFGESSSDEDSDDSCENCSGHHGKDVKKDPAPE